MVGLGQTGLGEAVLDRARREWIRLGRARLGWVKGNPQAAHFWRKNGFTETGEAYDADAYTVMAAERRLNP